MIHLLLYVHTLSVFSLLKFFLPMLRLVVSNDILQKTTGNLHADMPCCFGCMVLSARMSESKFHATKEQFETLCVYIFLAQKPLSQNCLLFFLPFYCFFSFFFLIFFAILYVLAIKKHCAVIAKQSAHTLLKLFPSDITILSRFEMFISSSSPSSTRESLG